MLKLNGHARWAGVVVAAMMLTFVMTRALSGDSAMTKSNEHRLDEQEKSTAVIMEKLNTISSDIKEVKRDVRRIKRHDNIPPIN